MNLLLDTHAFLWWREDSPRLRAGGKEIIAGADMVFVSAASAWEITIKVALGKLRIPGPVVDAVEDSGFLKLPITFAHAAAVAELPSHHNDPFDRILIAQARTEDLSLVTHDDRFDDYVLSVVPA